MAVAFDQFVHEGVHLLTELGTKEFIGFLRFLNFF
jgi:hypothetical protein